LPDIQWKKLSAVAAVAILLAAGAGMLFNPGGPFARAGNPAKEKYPVPPPNVAVTVAPGAEAEPTVAMSPVDHNTMVAGANDFNTLNGDKWDGFYTTHDRGRTWKRSLLDGYVGGPISPLTGYDASSDPVVVADPGGNFYYAGLAFKVHDSLPGVLGGLKVGRSDCMFVAKSVNGGDTFDQLSIVMTSFHPYVRGEDKEWMAVDPVSGNLYLAWIVFSGMNSCRIVFSRSTDGAQSWRAPLTLFGVENAMSVQGLAMVVDRTSFIHITWADYTSNRIRYSRSIDHGGSFSAPEDVAPVTPIPDPLPNGDFRTWSPTALAVDTGDANTSGSLYVTWADYGTGDSDVLLSYSHDGGKSWEGPVRVNNDPIGNGADQFFPAVAVSGEGWVHVGFYDRRSDPADRLLEYWWAMSFDGGRTFPVNIPMSNASFNGAYSPPYPKGQNNDFMGDYTSMDANNETVGAVWTDTRNASEAVQGSDIYGAFVPYKELLKTNRFANVSVPWP
jgi:hypothetical protein